MDGRDGWDACQIFISKRFIRRSVFIYFFEGENFLIDISRTTIKSDIYAVEKGNKSFSGGLLKLAGNIIE